MKDLHWGARSKHPLYRLWCRMRERCTSTKRHNAKHYQHVTVCERWESFEAFVEDVPLRPSANHTLDRIDGSRGYEPGNVRWATAKQQAENRRSTTWVEWNGERLTKAELARRHGISKATFGQRLARGLSIEEALRAS